MKAQTTWIALIAGVLLVPTIWLQANTDANGDGCVDLADYAAVQSTMTGPGCQPHEISSFYATGKEAFVLVDLVPGEQGFIVTDIIASERLAPPFTLNLIQDDGKELETKAALTMGAAGTNANYGQARAYHLETGIPFAAGTSILVDVGSSEAGVTVTGYTY